MSKRARPARTSSGAAAALQEKDNFIAVTCVINGESRALAVRPNEMLLDTLRRAGCTSVKEGCREAECGACTVLVDGLPVPSCHYPAVRAEGKVIITAEGLERAGQLHYLQEAFLAAGAVQCGFCTPGMLLSAKALLERIPRPGEDDIRTALDGNLCRCTGYVKIIAAVRTAADRRP